MKKVWMTIGLIGILTTAVEAQTYMTVDKTHIQSPPNASYQNNSQFYNKDNKITNYGGTVNSNGTYWQPGYSNDANRSRTSNGVIPSTSVNSSQNTSGNNYYNSTINNSPVMTNSPNNFMSSNVIVPNQTSNPSNNIGHRP